ncbi:MULTISPECIES: hypothetical protein [Peribacillus]|uniref:hypothetical protein n=1 Tax=Peribacillus TaxID=2675229 RepID=UPI001F4E674E|nr:MULTISPECIES: hypothetical protein [unclassified Peribacillus]MCK1984952.1 hypothetical protein [Peribacillus sp. Aquil_B1]MCK2009911.1 hypothetical protein [Peribacillus sp. Aquil_B8]
MDPYIKIKESPPIYIGRLTLQTIGIRKRIFHQMMFPNQLIGYGYYLNLITRLIGEEGTRLLREKRVKGRPRSRKPRRLHGRPRKASFLSGYPHPNHTSHKKTAGKLVFHRVCLQFDPPVVSTGFPFLQETVIAAVLVSAKT